MTLAEHIKKEAQQKYNIRPEILDSLYRYIDEGIPTGDFLRAVLENNLIESLGRADEGNRIALFDITSFLYNVAPAPCWGSPEKVKKWLERS